MSLIRLFAGIAIVRIRSRAGERDHRIMTFRKKGPVSSVQALARRVVSGKTDLKKKHCDNALNLSFSLTRKSAWTYGYFWTLEIIDENKPAIYTTYKLLDWDTWKGSAAAFQPLTSRNHGERGKCDDGLTPFFADPFLLSGCCLPTYLPCPPVLPCFRALLSGWLQPLRRRRPAWLFARARAAACLPACCLPPLYQKYYPTTTMTVR